jgi:hypothetical protein
MAQEANLNLELLKWVQKTLKEHGNANPSYLEWLFKNDPELPQSLSTLRYNPALRIMLELAILNITSRVITTNIEPIALRLEAKCGPTYIGFEWAIRRTLEYLQDRGSANVSDLTRDLWSDVLWIVRNLYWWYGGSSIDDAPKLAENTIPRLVKCVIEELAGEGLVRLEGNNVILA